MSAQDRTEQVLKDIHVLFSKAEPYQGSKRRVVIDKNEMMELLKELNSCMYEMLEEHELTVASREKANRKIQKQNDDMIFEARKNAQDVYAASITYSDHALAEIQNIIEESQQRIEAIQQEMNEKIRAERHKVRDNQYELKSQLQGLVDTQKYLRLIEEENKRLAQKAKAGKNKPAKTEENLYKDRQTGIKINEDYFRAQGIPIDDLDDLPEEKDSTEDIISIEKGKSRGEAGEKKLSEEEQRALQSELDAEYFEWKDEKPKDPNEPERRTFTLFGKKAQGE
ncbi:MAG: hypothetical protein J6N76_10665 [Lachnospiraceae bacterium]|nr:hypothetical protein [Lachnospiraceae bacterium]